MTDDIVTDDELRALAEKFLRQMKSDGNMTILHATGLVRRLLAALDAKDAEIERLTVDLDMVRDELLGTRHDLMVANQEIERLRGATPRQVMVDRRSIPKWVIAEHQGWAWVWEDPDSPQSWKGLVPSSDLREMPDDR